MIPDYFAFSGATKMSKLLANYILKKCVGSFTFKNGDIENFEKPHPHSQNLKFTVEEL